MHKKDVLIRSYFGDAHAHALLWAVRKLGADADIWFVSKFPGREYQAVHISENECPRWVIENDQISTELSGYRTIWNRRLGKRFLESESKIG